jgi:hypothetical protein
MDKHDLHPAQEYGYRAKTCAWDKQNDPLVRAMLLESLSGGMRRLRLEDGPTSRGGRCS